MSYKKSPFEQVPRKNVNLTRFDRSHEWKANLQPGYLIPCLLQEVLPMDRWRINTEFMFRFNPMYFPVMHKMTMRADYWWIPNRILWPEEVENPTNPGWKRWITEQFQTVPPQTNAQMVFDPDTWNNNVLGFMGLPLLREETGVFETEITNINALPLSAYLALWDEGYRNPQLEDPRWFPLTESLIDNTAGFATAFAEGVPTGNYFPCLSAKWQKDYFTSALPQPQIDAAIQIPMFTEGTNGPHIWTEADGTPAAAGADLVIGAGPPAGHTNAGAQVVFLDTQTEAATIKELRIAEVLQSFRERLMKIGNRYRDYFKGLWGGDPEPGVVDVPVLFGSTFGRVQISDVMSQAYYSFPPNNDFTSSPGDYTGQANLYENGNQTHSYNCREHGFIMCILQVNPNTSYGQGIHRMWRRDVQTDYALDMFAGIGDQEILKEEILYNAKTTDLAKNQDTFGYIERFAEYKYQNDIHIMQLNWTGGLGQHIGRIWNPETTVGNQYDELVINQTFINTMNTDADQANGKIRITDVWRLLVGKPFVTWPNQATIFAHLFHTITVDRALPLFSTPKLGL